MPILENIKATEAKVSEMKEKALEDVKVMIDNTKDHANKTAHEMLEQAEKQIKLKEEQNNHLIENKKQEIMNNMQEENKVNENLAKKNSSLVVDEIMRMVLEQ